MKIAFVIPRYRVPHAGGAEVLVQKFAEKLAQKGHSVDVLTTCAQDHTRWTNDFKEGEENIHGVCVHRFKVDERAHFSRFVLLQGRIDRGWPLNLREEMSWIGGSVHSQSLYTKIKEDASKWDALVFAPYLFGITYQGLQIAPEKSFLIPCLHPEPYAFLKIFQEMFQRPRGILFNALPEKELGKSIFTLPDKKCSVVGMGFEERSLKVKKIFREKFKIGSSPFLLYAGRREKGKNTPLLIDYFLTYKKHHPGNLKLVLLGSGKTSCPAGYSEDIMDCGFVTEEEKEEAYQEALAICQPSLNESFAIVLMESWLASTPVLVNAKCGVTRHHAELSGGGLWFKSFFEFEEGLNLFLGNEGLREKMGLQGRNYVLKNFQWENILEIFLNAIVKGLDQ